MKHYIFTAFDTTRFLALPSVEELLESDEGCFSVALKDDDELKVLMGLLGVKELTQKQLTSNQDFSALFDYSSSQLPLLNKEDFDAFYDKWLLVSGRESTMDEYGQLVFLQGRAMDWNKVSYRFVLREKT